MSAGIPDNVVAVGMSKVVVNWGWFLDQVDAGKHVVLTYHHERGRGTGRTMLSEPRGVAVPPSWYRARLAETGYPYASQRMGAFKVRTRFSPIMQEIRTSSAAGHSVHYIVAHKMQGEAERVFHRGGQGAPEAVAHLSPGSAGTERAVLVDLEWYRRAQGDLAVLHPTELPVATPPARRAS